jgi:hypothetical protein
VICEKYITGSPCRCVAARGNSMSWLQRCKSGRQLLSCTSCCLLPDYIHWSSKECGWESIDAETVAETLGLDPGCPSGDILAAYGPPERLSVCTKLYEECIVIWVDTTPNNRVPVGARCFSFPRPGRFWGPSSGYRGLFPLG